MLGIAAAALTAALKCDNEAVALESYWEPKLALVISSQSSKSAAARYKKDMWIPRPSGMDGFVAKLEETWGLAMALFGVGTDRYWYAASTIPLVPRIFFKATLIFILPLWLLVGLATFGVLWPPQVRRAIFRPRLRAEGEVKRNEAREFFASQIAGVRNEVVKLKGMSYEQSNDLYHEIRELKTILASAMHD